MNPENNPPKNRLTVLSVITVLVGAALCVVYILQRQGFTLENLYFGTLARSLGLIGLSLLALVLARTSLRLLLRREPFWRALESRGMNSAAIRTASGKILTLLNRTHPGCGAAVVAVVWSHCWFISRFYNLLPLRIVLALLAWQGIWGLVLKTPSAPAALRKRALLFHARPLTAALIPFFAALGHYLLRG
jgi:hypothetical protein